MRRVRVFVLSALVITAGLGVSPAVAQQRTAPTRAVPASEQSRIAVPESTRAIDGFLKMGDIKGESTDAAHEDWFDITAWSVEGSGAGDRAALARRQNAGTITIDLERSNPVLTEACNGGRSLGTVILHLRSRQNPSAYDEYRFEQSSIRACSRSANGSDGRVTLGFIRIESTPAGNPDRPVVIGR